METNPDSMGSKAEARFDALLASTDAGGEPEKVETPAAEKPTQQRQEGAAAQAERADDPLEHALAAILADETTQDQEETADAPLSGEPAKTDGKLSLALVAEKLGVDMKTLFDVPIPMPDEGEPCSLGELKDQAVRWRRSEQERLEWEGEQAHQQSVLATARDEVAGLVALIPEQYRTPAMLERVRDDLVKLRGVEAQKTLERIPEWSDLTQYKADQELMSEHASKHGFTPEEMKGVIDSRLLAYIRHNAKREQRIIEAGARARGQRESKHPTRTPGAGRKPAKTQTATTLHSSERQEKTAAMVGVLANQTR